MKALLLATALLPVLVCLAFFAAPIKSRRFAGPMLLLLIGLMLASLVVLHGQDVLAQARWFDSGGWAISVGVHLTPLTWFAASLVTTVSFPVTLYSIGYMAEDIDQPRFFAVLAFFISAMLILVLADSLILMFSAWEVVGVASYLLIGFHHRELSSARAASTAFLMTRVGDIGFLLAWLLVLSHVGTTDIDAFLQPEVLAGLNPKFLTLLALLFFAAAVGKSAQLPLSMWLPAVMVAPTPVSALLHSATMVAAGVFLLLRLYPLFAASPDALSVVALVGFISAGIAGILASSEFDMKRILAWSTISQLGEMFIAIGLGAPLAAALHLTSHAIFKAGLFLTAGAVDQYAGTRDLRLVGGLRRALPVTAGCFLLGTLSLIGIQFVFASTSQDAILAAALRTGGSQTALVVAILGLAGLYIGRAGAAVFLGPLRKPESRSGAVVAAMQAGMIIFGIASALIGLLIVWLPSALPFAVPPVSSTSVRFVGIAAGATGMLLGILYVRYRGVSAIFGHFPGKAQGILFALVQRPALAAFAVSRVIARMERGLDHWAAVLVRKAPNPSRLEHLIDAGSRRTTRFGLGLAGFSNHVEHHLFDRGLNRLGEKVTKASHAIRLLQSGKIYFYTLGLGLWIVALAAVAVLTLQQSR